MLHHRLKRAQALDLDERNFELGWCCDQCWTLFDLDSAVCHLELRNLRTTVRNPREGSNQDWNEAIDATEHDAIARDWARVIDAARVEFPEAWEEFDRLREQNEAEAAQVEQFIPADAPEAAADQLVRDVRMHQVDRGASPERFEIATLAGQSVADWTEVRPADERQDADMDAATGPPQKRAAEGDAAATPPKSPKPA